MRIRLLAILTLLLVLPAGYASAAVGSNICRGTTECTSGEVGTFMQGISVACGNLGSCTITDITQVFYNVGNFVLGIVGGLVFLAYVVGGFYFLLSGGPGIDQAKFRQKGMDALKKSTLGLVIVFVAYAGMTTLKTVLLGGSLNGTGNYVICGPGSINAGLACDLNSTCTTEGACVSQCVQQHPTVVTSFTVDWSECVDVNQPNYGKGDGVNTTGSCQQNLCPGPSNIQCCSFTYIYE